MTEYVQLIFSTSTDFLHHPPIYTAATASSGLAVQPGMTSNPNVALSSLLPWPCYPTSPTR